MAKPKEVKFTPEQLMQLIENYTDDELQAEINKAVDSEGAVPFWRLMNAFDAFIEKRRRKRGWGLGHTP